MASEVDVCNQALAHLGDVANVATIDPPDGSTQAEYAAKFYPQARDTLLEMHDWGFATAFVELAQLEITSPRWSCAYALPADAIKIIGTVPDWGVDSLYLETAREEIQGFGRTAWAWLDRVNGAFEVGADAIYSNQTNAVFAYVRRITDTTKFSPLFTRALGWLLASDLAGPILKGQVGQKATIDCLQMAMRMMGMGAVSDANQRAGRPHLSTPWITGR